MLVKGTQNEKWIIFKSKEKKRKRKRIKKRYVCILTKSIFD